MDNHGCHKRLGTSEEYKDFLTDLPDEILLHILSFLPTTDAIKTVLIRRFGNLWHGIPVLDFDQCMHHDCCNGPYYSIKFLNLIHQVLRLNNSPALDKLRLRFSFHKDYILTDDSEVSDEDYCSQIKGTEGEINLLVHYALSKKVKVLDLDLLGCGLYELIEDYIVPESVLRNNYLKELRLAFCNIESEGEIMLKSLKVLSLTEIELSDNIMQKIIVGSPNLEELYLSGCSGLSKLVCTGENLKKLALVLHMGRELIISCPNVISIEISGCIERAVLLDVRAVIEASVSPKSKFRLSPRKYDDVKRLLFQKFSQCHSFKPWTFSVLHEEKWIEADSKADSSCWNSHEANFFYHLKNISINGDDIMRPFVLEMVHFFLRSAIVLEKMIITYKKKNFSSSSMATHNDEFTSEELQEFKEKLWSFPRASLLAVIELSSS